VRGAAEQVEAALKAAPGLSSHDAREESPGVWRVHVALTGDEREALVAALVAAGVGLRRMVEDETELEQIFLGLTKEVAA